MKISDKGIALIKQFEGLELTSYRCPANVLTIGYGSTGLHVQECQTITEAQATELLKKDLVRFEEGVTKLVKVPLKQGQFDALVSFAFNVGVGALQKSTLLKRVNEGKFAEAAKEFLKWNKASGKVLKGLTRRREAEAALFNS